MKFRIIKSKNGDYKIQYKNHWYSFWWDHKEWSAGGSFLVTQWFGSFEEATMKIEEFIISFKAIKNKPKRDQVIKVFHVT